MTTENVVPQINGIDLKIAQIDGPNGRFDLAFAGAHKEGDNGFFYRDERGRFFFYAERYSAPSISWNVTHASTEAWSGASFKTSPENEEIFKKNIEFFFKTRRSSDPTKRGDDTSEPTLIKFSWRIV